MHGRVGEERKRIRHMCSVHPAGSTVVDAASAAADSSAPVSFSKDGRKISVGDTALFQAGNSPPFIGIIRSLTSNKDCLKLGVNWLYRPADVKLSKGILLEAAPNEVFYSFHKDEISAASLLHPCKVAFLRKGVELPSGISSFVCRRVYDIQNKCLWWLTDQDYINERQEEVDQLLDRTRLEMHAAVQSGARSPKPLNGPTSTQQSKPSSDSVQNSTTSFPLQGKGKKRERVDQGTEHIKRERSTRTDDGDSGHYKLESTIKAEIAKITEKGGLINSEGVDQLVHLMQDRADKKMDLAGRIMLAHVISATDKPECLDRFVQLRGVHVLNEWLQEAHKGKVGDGNSPKESDKCVEEFLLALLRALDKLPVNLHALQNSNVGKSVNNLRSHKNLDIQKKARTLVDTWKKRVDMEMKINDAKSASNQSVSWTGKSGFSEVSHGGNRRSGSSEVAIKSIITQPSASKTGAIKLGNVDIVPKSTSAPPGSTKFTPSSPVSVTAGPKDSHCKIGGSSGTSDMPLMTIREEKSSSSSQSQNNSQSCSSDHAKNACKEDARSSTAGSMNAKTSSGVSRGRKSSNGFLGSGVQKESILGKPGSLNRNTTHDKTLQAGPTCERSVDNPPDHGNSHRLIVRLPNPGRSPARSASGGSFDDPSVIVSRASSPGVSDKHDHHDRKTKGKGDNCRFNISAGVNTESWQSNDVKNGLSGSDEGDRSPAAVSDEERIRSNVENVKLDSSKATCSSSGNEKGDLPKSGKPLDASFSINALIESCKYSEASSSLSVGDDLGMNLLASVATGEISKSEPVSPNGSPEMRSPAREDTLMSDSVKLRSSHDDLATHGHQQIDDNADSDPEKLVKSASASLVRDAAQQIGTHETCNISGENKGILPSLEHKAASKHTEEFIPSSVELNQTADPSLKFDGEPDRTTTDGGARSTGSTAIETPHKDLKEEIPIGEGTNQLLERSTISISGERVDGAKVVNGSLEDIKKVDFACEKVVESSMVVSDSVHASSSDQCDIGQVTTACIQVEKEAVEESSSCLMDGEKMDVELEKLSDGAALMKQLPLVVTNHAEALGRNKDAVAPCSIPCLENTGESKPEKINCMDTITRLDPSDVERIGQTTLEITKTSGSDETSERKETLEHCPSGSAPDEELQTIPAQETDQCKKSMGSKLSGVEADETEECVSTAEVSSLSNATGSDTAAKLDFDLNEGFPVDEGNPSDPVMSIAPGCTSAVQLSSPMPYPVSPLTSSLPASVTVAAAAKGPFVHAENLLRCKGELGWKGSAATSAFRPAEPRKVLEMLLSATDVTSCDNAPGKHSRPPLDIDLNVPDERILEDVTSRSTVQESGSGSGTASNNRDLGHNAIFSSSTVRSAGGLDLDLNRADEGTENGQLSVSTTRRYELLPVISSSSGGFSNGEVNILRDFDLNNGPGLDEVGAESAQRNQHAKSSGPSPSHVAGLRMNNPEFGSISSWFPPGSSYPPVNIPSLLQDRGEQTYPFVATAGPHRMLGPPASGTFGSDLYRGPVLSSSPAMGFPPAAPFPYGSYPFGNSFPLASTSFAGGATTFVDSSSGGASCFPAVPSQLVGPAGSVSSHYPRQYMMGLPEGTGGGAESSRKWGRQSLDLNAGPGSTDVVGRDERLTSISGQLSVANPQGLTEEQARAYQTTGGPMRRKEPEGGWEPDRFSYKQPSRQ
ncbi:Bromo adjacent BAH domain-containing protein [Cinnamomum micranthum f. kanehirae]|uniref:Bromo adjacent BAH domain-containing protein n=1 Tax=Cinnamomum micranthum f. kanehirae TaxID=337451 RepID=A0A443NXM9_9MAGN|nr:Bromo adjacent BAH domain-containing protein [Cinnamomum micranthum f. kanehirae]